MEFLCLKGDVQRDKQDFIAFWKEHFPTWPAAKYDFFYRDNPHGPAGIWLARTKDNQEVIGTNVVFPKRMVVAGEEMLVGVYGDFGVNKSFRNLGVGREMVKDTLIGTRALGCQFVYATPNHMSGRVSEILGYQIVGRTVRMVKILKSREYFRRYLKTNLLAAPLAAVADWFLKLKSRDSRYQRPADYDTEVRTVFDSRFDTLWTEAAPYYNVVGERSSQFLNWRFGACPYKDFSVFCLKEKTSGRLLGYIVYQVRQQRVLIDDILVIDPENLLDPLIAEFVRFGRSQGIDTISFYYLGSKKFTDGFARHGFSARADSRLVIVALPPEYRHERTLLKADNWHFLGGDNDAEN